MQSLASALAGYIGAHPGLATLLVFLLAASESVVLVGALVPGTAILVALSAMIGMGRLPLWPILAAAVAGAVAGDGFSYWIGHHWRERIAAVWPFSRHPALLERGHAFFARHGAKSLFVARFTPGVRAVIPVLAGSAGMAPGRFIVANVGSALVWAPSHVLPGALAGLGLGIAGRVSGRLLALLVVLALAAAVAVLLLRLILRLLLPRAGRLRLELVQALRQRPTSAGRRLALLLLDPQDGLRPLLLPGLPLAGLVVAFVALTEEVLDRAGVTRVDRALNNFFSELRSDPGDDAMIFLTSFGDWPVMVATVTALSGSVLLQGRRRLAGALALVMGFCAALTTVLKVALGVARPGPPQPGLEAFGFPSGHASAAVTLFGLLAWMALSGGSPAVRRHLPPLLATMAALIAASRLYLGAHWPSDVLGGLLLGLSLVLLTALAFRNRPPQATGGALAAALCTFLATGALWAIWHGPAAEQRYARSAPPLVELSREAWLSGGWRSLPRARLDLAGEGDEEPIVLQWAGPEGALEAALRAEGWEPAVVPTLVTLGRFLGRNSAADLLVLPRLDDGRRPRLLMIRPELGDGAGRRAVLAAWPSGVEVDGIPLLLVGLWQERISHPLSLVTFVDEVEGTMAPLQLPDVVACRDGAYAVLLGPTGDTCG